MLGAAPAGAEAGDELQLGGFMAADTGAPGVAETLQEEQIGAGLDSAYPQQFAPSSVGLPLDSAWIDNVRPSQAGTGATLGVPGRTADQEAVSYFTPRFGGLQLGAAYTPPASSARSAAAAAPLRDSRPGNDITLGVTYLDTFWGVDVALTGGYRSSSLPGAGEPDLEFSDQESGLQRYSVGTSIGFSGLRLGGSFARDVGDDSLGVQSWDAGVSYATGPWTIGVDYLQSDLVGAGGIGGDGEAVQAGLTYAVGPGIVASFNVMHRSGDDRDGNTNGGTLGILGFSYNF